MTVGATTLLSGCLGSGEEGGTVLSSGLLELDVPNAASRADLPADVNEALDALIEANENGLLDLTPDGRSEYRGDFILALGENDITVTGDASLFLDLDATGGTFSISPDEALDEGEVVDAGGHISSQITVTNGEYTGSIEFSNLTIGSGEEFLDLNMDGTVNGLFTQAGETFGEFSGGLTEDVPDGASDTYDGLFFMELGAGLLPAS